MANVLVRLKLHVLFPRSELAEFNIPRPFGVQKLVGAAAVVHGPSETGTCAMNAAT
jgi:hypothetical protein